MRVTEKGSRLTCRAISGTYVVTLGWDTNDGKASSLGDDLLGFAVERSELKGRSVIERYWLQGIKRFRQKDRGLPPGTLVSTAEHPIQTFQWADYTAQENRRYRYRLVPVRGTPKKIELDEGAATIVEVATEPEISHSGSEPRHDVYFNRGVIGSQAYARRFNNRTPDGDDPSSEEMRWLSRHLFEALIGFIEQARDESFSLRCSFYEFRYQPVANALARAAEAGVDVQIVYDAHSNYKTENLQTIQNARLDELAQIYPRTVSEGIRHNKFMVLLKRNQPVAIWTGSTNISLGGIFGHSNVGHVVRDKQVATQYLEYWDRLAQNLTPGKLRGPNKEASPLPQDAPPPDSVIPLFSPRDSPASNDTLEWYARQVASAKRMVCLTVAFNLDEVFQKVIAPQSDVLRYIVKDDDLGQGETIGRDHNVLFAAGRYLGAGWLENFLAERDNPLNRNNYIHDKFMLVDPLSDDPLVITGSANFSRPSQRSNDENMLVIRGNQRVADIYFGEFMRIFDHHYARYVVSKLRANGTGDPDAGYLKESSDQWLPPHFDRRNSKWLRRRYFVGK